jgi:hypothetical protein
MRLEILHNLVVLNVPHLDFTLLSSHTEEVLINLVEAGGTLIVFVRLLESTLAGL